MRKHRNIWESLHFTMISLNAIYLTYKLNHSTFKVKDLQQVPQHFLEKNPNSSSWPINKVLLVVPSASSLAGHSPPHSLRLQEHWPHFCCWTYQILSTSRALHVWNSLYLPFSSQPWYHFLRGLHWPPSWKPITFSIILPIRTVTIPWLIFVF